MHLRPADLQKLEDILVEDFDSPTVRIKANDGDFTYTYESIDELLDDHHIPDFVYSLLIEIREGQKRVTVRLRKSRSRSSIRISGPREWVTTKQSHLERFTSQHSRPIRTYIQDLPLFIPLFTLGFILGVGTVGLLVKPFVGIEWAGFVGALVTIPLFIYGMDWFEERGVHLYAYSILNLRDKDHRPYLRYGLEAIGTIAALLTIWLFMQRIL